MLSKYLHYGSTFPKKFIRLPSIKIERNSNTSCFVKITKNICFLCIIKKIGGSFMYFIAFNKNWIRKILNSKQKMESKWVKPLFLLKSQSLNNLWSQNHWFLLTSILCTGSSKCKLMNPQLTIYFVYVFVCCFTNCSWIFSLMVLPSGNSGPGYCFSCYQQVNKERTRDSKNRTYMNRCLFFRNFKKKKYWKLCRFFFSRTCRHDPVSIKNTSSKSKNPWNSSFIYR